MKYYTCRPYVLRNSRSWRFAGGSSVSLPQSVQPSIFSRLLLPRGVSQVWVFLADSCYHAWHGNLDSGDDIPVYTGIASLEPWNPCQLSCWHLQLLSQHFYRQHLDRYSAHDIAAAEYLAASEAKISEDCTCRHIRIRWLVRDIWPPSHLRTDRLSVVIVSIIRLVNLVNADFNSQDTTWNIAPVIMWSGTEINIAIVCGKYFLVTLADFRRWL